ncbi:MAG: SprT-like domain-containing protein [Lentimicrobium sp.]
MTKGRSLDHALNEYLPAGSAGPVLEWFRTHHVVLRITRSRRSKLGDFRGSTPFTPPVISVNHNLNPYSFLVTLLHEMAHAEVFFNSRRRMQPHGDHWKQAYQALGQPFLVPGLLPESVRGAFENYLRNPSASSTTNLKLAEALRAFDAPKEATLISELPADALFSLPDGRMFKRGDKLRKRYRCECLNNKRIYLFSPLAEIIPVENKA